MTKEVVSVSPETSVIEVAQLLFDRDFDGVPVVSNDNKLLGVITQWDLVSKGANVHIPTFIKLMQDFPIHKQDSSKIRPELEKILTLKVGDIMNKEPLIISPEVGLEEAAKIFGEHHGVNPLPVVKDSLLVGIISRYDIIKLYAGTQKTASKISRADDMDNKVATFMDSFEKRFVVVSKIRSKFWFLISLLFIIAGFIIAMFLMLRVEPK
ncbi:MAG: CBS-domain-containing membrane protein [Parcubacteria group bacterium Licking1014_17]|nr:MAG: CBS-domain-containing membrane protein [Parcubacteria group bacterium Licking1014_17]